MEIENIGNPHVPFGMRREVSEEDGKKLIATKKWGLVGESKSLETVDEVPVEDLSHLAEVKGIGKETIKDLENIYSSEEELIKALKSGKHIPVRSDVIDLLKEHFNIGENEMKIMDNRGDY